MNKVLQEALLRAREAEPLSRDQLLTASKDARLSLTDGELAPLSDEVARILAFASVLEDFEATDGEALPLEAVASEEKQPPPSTLSREDFLMRAPAHEDEFATVPAVLS